MFIHATHWPEFSRVRWILALAGLVLLLIWWIPAPVDLRGIANYLPLHGLLETIAIVVSGLIFAINWHTPLQQTTRNAVILCSVFLGVAMLDFTHTWSFAGMPSLVTPSSAEKSIYFWLSARTLAAAGILMAAFLPWHQAITREQSWLTLAVVILVVLLLHLLVIFYPQKLPLVFVEGMGLTAFKIQFEYLLVGIYLLASARIALRLRHPRTASVSDMLAATLLMAMSEFLFTLYAEVTDHYNLAGHIFKVLAYYYLYQALFVESLLSPYERLLEKQGQLTTTLNALPDLLFEVDEMGYILDAHSGRAELLAFPPEDFLRKRYQDILPPAAVQACTAAMQEAKVKGRSQGQSYELDVPDGHCWFELSVAYRAGSDPSKARYVVISRDITSRVQYEETLRQDARLNATLLSLPEIAESMTTSEMLNQVMEQARLLTGSSLAFVGIVSRDEKTLSPWSCTGSLADLPEWHLGKESVWDKAVKTRRPQVFNLPQELTFKTQLSPDLGSLNRWISVPVFDGGILRMVVGVGNRSSHYTHAHIEGLELLADSVWRLHHRKEVDKELRQLSLAVAQSPNAIVITDLKANIEFVNEAFTRSSGYRAEEVIGKNPRLLQSKKTPANTYRQMWAQLGKGESWQGEFINRRKNGEEYFERSLIYPVRDDSGQITHYLAHKEDITERKAASDRIQFLSHFDTLTGLPNRILLKEQLEFTLNHSRRSNSTLSVLWLDLDQFKEINDNFGHAGGDQLLREVTKRMRAVVREEDLIARYSGDSFVLVLPDADQHGAVRVADSLLRALAQPLMIDAQELVVTASIGVALFPTDAAAADGLLRSAESAMYRAKSEGRNGYRFFAPEMQERSARALLLSNGLKLALTRHEFRVVYQPQMCLKTHSLVGAEALLRWHHPQLGEIAPTEFIGLAEGSGLIGQIGEWVLGTVVQQLRDWQDRGLPLCKIAVNLSPFQLSQVGFPAQMASKLAQAGVPTRLLELELTEAAAMKDTEQVVDSMSELARLGFSLSIDDFGTGYSSLSYLKRFAVSKLKIDQSFIRDLVEDGDDQAIVGAIIDMAHSLGIIAIAEGVETPEQMAFLKQRFCDEIQGYIYSKPMELSEFETFLQAKGLKT